MDLLILHYKDIMALGFMLTPLIITMVFLVSTTSPTSFLENLAGKKLVVTGDPVVDLASAQEIFRMANQTAYLAEAQAYGSREDGIFRESVCQQPILGGVTALTGAGGIITSQSGSGAGPLSVSSTINFRSYKIASVCFIMYWVSYIVGNDPIIRQQLKLAGEMEGQVPLLMIEKCNSLRNSIVENCSFTFNVTLVLWNPMIKLLKLEKTIWDVEWLRTDLGAAALYQFLQFVFSHSNCYIASSTLGKMPILFAGKQITACSINTAVGIVNFFKHNSYGGKFDGVHIVDSVLEGRVLLDDKGIPVDGNCFVTSIQIVSSSQSYGLWLMQRTTGKVKNGSGYTPDKPLTAPKPRGGSAPKAPAPTKGGAPAAPLPKKGATAVDSTESGFKNLSLKDLSKFSNFIKKYKAILYEINRFKTMLSYTGKKVDELSLVFNE